MSVQVYVVLERLLFVLHLAGAAFVAGGTGWLVLRGIAGLFAARPAESAEADPVAAGLRDWLPFALGLAITFGVGPLLFVQLRDGRAFYTANLLLSHRFMVVLPALIVGFYLLYLQKTRGRSVRSRLGRLLIPALAFACFGFTAWSWSENHLLAQSRGAWPEVYLAGPGFFGHADLVARLTVFAGIAAQAAAIGLSLALGRGLATRRLAAAVAVGVVLVAVGCALHPAVPGVRLLGGLGIPILVAEVLILGLWLAALRRATPVRLFSALALLLAVERFAAIREAIRLARGGENAFAESASAQGSLVFTASLLFALAAIAWSVRRVAADLRAG